MSWSRAFCDWVALATASSRPPCGGGPGWGVARTGEGNTAIRVHIFEPQAAPAEGVEIGMARPPSRPPPQGGRRVLAGAAALFLAGSLAGCFQPLYSEAAHPGLVEDLRAIDVAPIDKRIGHYLAQDLIADLNGTGQTASPAKYRLTVTVSLGTQTPTVNSEINVASSATVTGEATYTLTKVDGGAEVLKGNAQAAAAYDRSTQQYADMRAARDAEIRIARALSSEISLRLASALAAKSS